MNASQVHFFAQDELIDVLPTAPLPEMRLVCGTFGPFAPMRPVRVPLWLAVELKRRGRARIKPPAWLDREYLRGVVEAERTSAAFEALESFHFFPVAYAVLAAAPDDVRDVAQVRALLEDVRAVRAAKLREGIVRLGGADVMKMRNLGSAELNTPRRFLCAAMAAVHAATEATLRVEAIAATAMQPVAAADAADQPFALMTSTDMPTTTRRVLRPQSKQRETK
jgi:GINS complex subunit 2